MQAAGTRGNEIATAVAESVGDRRIDRARDRLAGILRHRLCGEQLHRAQLQTVRGRVDDLDQCRRGAGAERAVTGIVCCNRVRSERQRRGREDRCAAGEDVLVAASSFEGALVMNKCS